MPYVTVRVYHFNGWYDIIPMKNRLIMDSHFEKSVLYGV